MDSTPKFVKFLSDSDFESNEIRIPPLFCTKIANLFPSHVKLVFRNGYKLWVNFSKNGGLFYGLNELYNQFGLRRGQTLLFEYARSFEFNVFIIGVDCCEIKYSPNPVGVLAGGWKFVHFLSCVEPCIDELGVPSSFVARFGRSIPSSVEFVYDSSIRFFGSFFHNECKVTGLIQLCKMLEIPNLNAYGILVFTYDGHCTFKIDVYDASLTDGLVPTKRICDVGTSTCNTGTHVFEIVVKPFHMLKYSHGVDIPAAFKSLTDLWGMNHIIHVYQGKKCWSLEIRKRAGFKRPTILGGWLEFRDGLKLGVGDKCVFRQKSKNIKDFTVEVVKKID